MQDWQHLTQTLDRPLQVLEEVQALLVPNMVLLHLLVHPVPLVAIQTEVALHQAVLPVLNMELLRLLLSGKPVPLIMLLIVTLTVVLLDLLALNMELHQLHPLEMLLLVTLNLVALDQALHLDPLAPNMEPPQLLPLDRPVLQMPLIATLTPETLDQVLQALLPLDLSTVPHHPQLLDNPVLPIHLTVTPAPTVSEVRLLLLLVLSTVLLNLQLLDSLVHLQVLLVMELHHLDLSVLKDLENHLLHPKIRLAHLVPKDLRLTLRVSFLAVPTSIWLQ